MRAIGLVSLQHLVVGDQTLSALRQENLVAKFHRLARLAPLDQIGVSLKDGVDLLIHRNLLPIDHPAEGLVDDPVGQVAVRSDLRPELVDRHACGHVDPS
jgi:hypothetical protein